MSAASFFAELRRRGVLKVALAYAAIGWVALQVLSLLFDNFDAPGWVIKVVTTLVILGFPVACLMAWGFDITPEGVRPVPPAAKEPAPAALPAAEAAESSTPSIAVLPFLDMSAEQDQQYLGDGIAEELLTALSAVEGLKVAARISAFSFRGHDVTMKEIGDVLHVRHVLEGSVRRSGQKLRVTAQLVDVKSGFHLYSQAYDREMSDIFDIQNEVAREIVKALMPRLGLPEGARLVSQGTTSTEAYNSWICGHPWLYNPDPATADTAIAHLRQAVALDPRYADAWADLAYVHTYQSTWTGEPMPLMLEAATAAAVALVHDPDNATALLYQALRHMSVGRDVVAAEGYLRRARAAGVDLSLWAFTKAYIHDGPLGRYDEAIADLREAEALDPLAPNVKQALLEMQLGAGRVADALATAEAVQQLGTIGPEIIGLCGLAYLAAGDVPRARALCEDIESRYGSLLPELTYLWQDLAIAGAGGGRNEVGQMLERLLQGDERGRARQAHSIADCYRALGEYDKAFEWWARSVERYETWSLSVMPIRNRRHPVIGRDPRFHALLRRMKLEPPPS